MELIAFTLATAGLLALPGPNVIIVAATSAAHGRLRGIQTVAGTTGGIAIQLLVAALATNWLATLLAEHFHWVRWVGMAYLVWFVLSQVRQARKRHRVPPSAGGSFHRGFWIALSNPKTILFFSAFLPQFTVDADPYLPQIALLSAITWVLALLRDMAYMLLADRLSFLVDARVRSVEGTE
ncbi:MAG: LysE family translocator [Pseudomonadota bacterium]